MYSDVILIHRPGGQGRSTLADDLKRALAKAENAEHELFSWQTCLRQISLIDEAYLDAVRPVLLRGDEIYHSDVGYRFLLEVICGLHSPLVGETEVYGQFKNAVAAAALPLTPWGTRLKRFFKALFEDAKQIRQEFLEDLGSQSYGSVLRRDLKGVRRIHVIGAGQLVQEILPWISGDESEVHVHARDVGKAKQGLGATGQSARFHALGESLAGAEAVIVAAPVTSAFASGLVDGVDGLRLVIDLRADSATDKVATSARLIDLAEVFSRLAANQALLEERKAGALKAIQQAAQARGGVIENRPFGWEDVCA